MGFTATQYIRIYPKHGKVSALPYDEVCKHLARTAMELDKELIFYLNEQENCLELKFNSRRATGDINLNLSDFFIWRLRSDNDGSNEVVQLESHGISQLRLPAVYAFDKIIIEGDKDKLTLFLDTVCKKTPKYWDTLLEGSSSEQIELDISGTYHTWNEYEPGKEYSRVPKQVNLSEFHKLRGTYAFFNLIETTEEKLNLTNGFLEEIYEDYEYERFFDGLNAVCLSYKGRIVEKVRWESFQTGDLEGRWNRASANGFDNLVVKDFNDFKSRYQAK
ncbi:hypothetical protein BKI52_16935 [marine bacterium AO1-C]|nr:hypothetical protein BKI52_16935 [marine bacterium AO1-C]